MVLALICSLIYVNRVQIKTDPCSGQRNELINLFFVLVYLYDVKCVVCK